MTVRSHAGPLTATLSERIQATPEISVIRRRPVLVTPQETPAPTEAPETMPRKTKKIRTQYTDKYKAAIVKRVIAGRRDGTETIVSIAGAEGIPSGNINKWVKAAKVNGKLSTKKTKRANGAASTEPTGDLASITSELTEAMALVARLKKRLLELLS